MLTKFKKEEPVVYQILNSAIKNNKCSHAYLFEVKNKKHMEIINIFIKEIVCPYKYGDCKKENCNICKRIDENMYDEIVNIKPDGNWIKKQQMIDLKLNFSNKAIEGNKKIYIINECEKLNPSSANSILKMLEEPDNNIIAILITKNSNLVIKTIFSRCQLIKFKNNNEETKENVELQKMCIKFVNKLEENGYNAVLDFNEIQNYILKEGSLEEIMNYILNFYIEILKYKNNETNLKLNIYKNDIIEIANKNSISRISDKIRKIINLKNQIKYNLNTNLFIDKFLIEMEKEL